ncbi:hypothetical protein M231_02229 [Tremella mesenterica]|uniref:Uncharacterized protein n=1 Tax=Tremella mesenterica TaxID=5217 RepID=A0A4Q1BR21_TREME|nr:hypothetical protein M231_02229 [Tremella mesenterica]
MSLPSPRPRPKSPITPRPLGVKSRRSLDPTLASPIPNRRSSSLVSPALTPASGTGTKKPILNHLRPTPTKRYTTPLPPSRSPGKTTPSKIDKTTTILAPIESRHSPLVNIPFDESPLDALTSEHEQGNVNINGHSADGNRLSSGFTTRQDNSNVYEHSPFGRTSKESKGADDKGVMRREEEDDETRTIIDHAPSQGTLRREPGDMGDIDAESWELRTETAVKVDDFDETSLGQLQAVHHKQLTHYKNLLVRAQSASSSSLHDLHTKLHQVETLYNNLLAEHALCAGKVTEISRDRQLENTAAESLKNGEGLGVVIRGMNKDDRIHLLGVIVEGCHPSDVNAQIALLEKYRRSRLDILGRVGDDLAVKILSLLDIKDLLTFRSVSFCWFITFITGTNWRLVSVLSTTDPECFTDDDREELYRSLWRREKNWNRGLAQNVLFLKGHTNYVTSLRLRGDVLISGSYDETIRVWHLPPLQTIHPTSLSVPLILPAKSVSCLDFCPAAEVFVAGSHDIGRVQVYQKSGEEWKVVQTLSGHLHGIRAVAVNEKWMVSAGADKALVVWDWRTGEKIVRFGQQTNICIGIQLVHDYIVAVTVDGIIRTFSIAKREMIAQYKISDLSKSSNDANVRMRLKDVGGGVGGTGMLTWFEGQGRYMTCATREMIIRMSWEEIEEIIPVISHKPSIFPSSPIERRALRGKPPNTPPRQRTTSGSLSAKKSITNLRPVNPSSPAQASPSPLRRPTPVRGLSGSNASTPLSASNTVDKSDILTPLRNVNQRDSLTPLSNSKVTNGTSKSVSARGTAKSLSTSTTPRKVLGGQRSSVGEIIPEDQAVKGQEERRVVPLLNKAPKLLEVVDAPDIERGAVDARRTRVVTSTRFAARSGADRRVGWPNL